MNSRLLAVCLGAALVAISGPLHAGTNDSVAGEKVDSGLGELPHYAQWADPSGKGAAGVKRPAVVAIGAVVVGEKIDSGLGQLPHYSRWADVTGKHPLAMRDAATAVAAR